MVGAVFSQGFKYLAGLMRGGLRILLNEGDIGILRNYMYFPVFGEEIYAIQKIKTGMHGCV